MTVARDLDAKLQDLLQEAAAGTRYSGGDMAAAHIVRASFKDEICDRLASFTLDAERSLAAVYHCVQEIYGDRAAWCAAEAWLGILEERLEELGRLPKLTAITAAAIAFSVSNLIGPSAKAATYFGATVT